MFAISLVIVTAGLLLAGLSLRFLFGMRFKRKVTSSVTERSNIDPRPVAVMRVVNTTSSSQDIQDTVPILAFNEIYASVGATSEAFEKWEQQHGMDSLGVAADGTVFIPDYPVLSKIAWMYVDSVTLTRAETLALVGESERAAHQAASGPAMRELEAISLLARRAQDVGSVIRFGP